MLFKPCVSHLECLSGTKKRYQGDISFLCPPVINMMTAQICDKYIYQSKINVYILNFIIAILSFTSTRGSSGDCVQFNATQVVARPYNYPRKTSPYGCILHLFLGHTCDGQRTFYDCEISP